MTRCRSIEILALVLTLFGATNVASADAVAKARRQMSQHLAKSANAAFKDLKRSLKQRKTNLFHSLDQLDAGLSSGGFVPTDGAKIAFPLIGFQLFVAQDAEQMIEDFGGTLPAEYSIAVSVGISPSGMPDGFLAGSGGTLDRLGARATKAIAKTIGSVRKRLAKTAKRIRDATGVEVAVVVEPPVTLQLPIANAIDVEFPHSLVTPLRIDTIVAASALDSPGDARVFVGGSANASNPSIYVALKNQVGSTTSTGSTSAVNGRWGAVFSDQSEGNFFATVLITTSSASADDWAYFSIR